MIAPSLVEEIRRLLAEDRLSQRKIARVLRVSRGTVGLIATGKRPDYEVLRGYREDDGLEPAGPPSRCPTCGGMVYLPCILCRTREVAPSPRGTPLNTICDEPIGLQLKEEHRQRYEQVLAARRRDELLQSV